MVGITTTAAQHKHLCLDLSFCHKTRVSILYFQPKLLWYIYVSHTKLALSVELIASKQTNKQTLISVFVLFLQDKCCQYWPTEDSVTYGDYTVELKGDTLCDTFSLRDLVLTFVPVSK